MFQQLLKILPNYLIFKCIIFLVNTSILSHRLQINSLIPMDEIPGKIAISDAGLLRGNLGSMGACVYGRGVGW